MAKKIIINKEHFNETKSVQNLVTAFKINKSVLFLTGLLINFFVIYVGIALISFFFYWINGLQCYLRFTT